MLSSKKSVLINYLLEKITSNVNCNIQHHHHPQQQHQRHHQSKPPPKGGHCHQLAFNLWNYILSKCCCTACSISNNENEANYLKYLKKLRFQKIREQLHCLKKHQLQSLTKVIKNGGRNFGECILVQQHSAPSPTQKPQQLHSLNKLPDLCSPCKQEQYSPLVRPSCVNDDDDDDDEIDSQLLVCLLCRWPRNKISQKYLRPLPWCVQHSSFQNWDDIAKQSLLCINPFHWSLLNGMLII